MTIGKVPPPQHAAAEFRDYCSGDRLPRFQVLHPTDVSVPAITYQIPTSPSIEGSLRRHPQVVGVSKATRELGMKNADIGMWTVRTPADHAPTGSWGARLATGGALATPC